MGSLEVDKFLRKSHKRFFPPFLLLIDGACSIHAEWNGKRPAISGSSGGGAGT
jgi:hypothetical protein